MATDGATPPRSGERPDPPSGRASVNTSPVAVVWCRQVDNEAESPGYTTVPEEFPGQRETLEAIRLVGNLTINVADTHDYWDPDPSQPLSYYPNLFLYPANGGRYTCVGRMFLSTEDRPRLGMKTLVLDTAQLLASGEFGPTVLRWHASMGGPRREGARPPPAPDPALYPVLGEGLLFHRGSTDPVVVVAADDWESVMATILELIRLLPASLVALGAILAFPYFLPQAKTNLHEFTEQLPLALALMRVPRAEAAGDRHSKRMASWESAPVTLRDLTAGLPSAKGKENVPLVLQYARDGLDPKLLPISQRVDLVEVSRVRGHLADPERQSGRDRRKEMWRIGTAMESAALLLQRARGRHVPVNVETAKRAQEYLQARLPETDRGAAPSVVAEPAVVPGGALLSTSAVGGLPPWLRPPPEAAAPAAPSEPEVVPVSKSEDPSLLTPQARANAPATPTEAARAPLLPGTPPADPPTGAPPAPVAPRAPPAAPAGAPATFLAPARAAPPPPPVSAVGPPIGAVAPEAARGAAAPAGVDIASLRSQLQQDLFRLLEDRIATLPRRLNSAPAFALDEKLRQELDAATDARIRAVVGELTTRIQAALTAAEARQRQLLDERVTQDGAQRTESLRQLLSGESDRRLTESLARATTESREQLRQELLRSAQSASESGQRAQEQLAATVAKLVEAKSGESREMLRQELAKAALSLTDSTQKAQEQISATLFKLGDAKGVETREQLRRELAAATSEMTAAAKRSEEAIRGALTAQLDLHLGELSDREAQLRQELQALLSTTMAAHSAELESRRTKEQRELEQRLALLVDGRSRELSDKLQSALETQAVRSAGQLEELRRELDAIVPEPVAGRLAEIEARRAKESKELEQRVGQLVEARLKETGDRLGGQAQAQETRLASLIDQRVGTGEERIRESLEAKVAELQEDRVTALADLQVRLQSFFEQKLREDQERERSKYVELLARLKTEVDSSLSRMVDASRFDTALRERVSQAMDTLRTDQQRALDARLATAEQKLVLESSDLTAQLARLENLLEERRGELQALDKAIRNEIDDLDRRTQILSDRLVPIVRKTWLRVAEMQPSEGTGPETEAQINQLRRDVTRELHRLDAELLERTTEIRDRMETAISNQGRVWLTLIRQLSQLTGDRRRAGLARGLGGGSDLGDLSTSVFPEAPDEEDDPVNPLDPDPSEPLSRGKEPAGAGAGDAARRRFRRSAR